MIQDEHTRHYAPNKDRSPGAAPFKAVNVVETEQLVINQKMLSTRIEAEFNDVFSLIAATKTLLEAAGPRAANSTRITLSMTIEEMDEDAGRRVEALRELADGGQQVHITEPVVTHIYYSDAFAVVDEEEAA